MTEGVPSGFTTIWLIASVTNTTQQIINQFLIFLIFLYFYVWRTTNTIPPAGADLQSVPQSTDWNTTLFFPNNYVFAKYFFLIFCVQVKNFTFCKTRHGLHLLAPICN